MHHCARWGICRHPGSCSPAAYLFKKAQTLRELKWKNNSDIQRKKNDCFLCRLASSKLRLQKDFVTFKQNSSPNHVCDKLIVALNPLHAFSVAWFCYASLTVLLNMFTVTRDTYLFLAVKRTGSPQKGARYVSSTVEWCQWCTSGSDIVSSQYVYNNTDSLTARLMWRAFHTNGRNGLCY